jgi:hypothetical protein
MQQLLFTTGLCRYFPDFTRCLDGNIVCEPRMHEPRRKGNVHDLLK